MINILSDDGESMRSKAFVSRALARMETAQDAGLVGCHVCSLVSGNGETHCRRCQAVLHGRKPNSIQRTWAYLLTAAGLYVPAMVLPVSTVHQLGESHTTTLMGSVVSFVESGAIPIALVIFIASVVVPLFKLIGLAYLLVSVQRRSRRFPMQRTRLYRLIEFVGRWSMIDVFVVALLVALVQIGVFVSIDTEPGIIAFAAVVVLTIFASNAFDPRLIWDRIR